MKIEVENIPAAVPNTSLGIEFPFADMQVGQSFKFPLSAYPGKKRDGGNGDMSALLSWLSSNTRKYTKANEGVKFAIVRVTGEEAYRVGRTA